MAIADGLAFVLALALILYQMRQWKNNANHSNG